MAGPVQRVVIEYNPVEREVKVVENDFDTIELFGILTYVKEMAAEWEFYHGLKGPFTGEANK